LIGPAAMTHESMRDLLRLHLETAGFQVDLAEDGIAAGYAVLRAVPDLIICDVDMPNMDGFQLISALRADHALPKIPVIFLTSIEEGAQRGAQLGAAAYLTKPIRADTLLNVVRRALEKT
jgi:DNA-binding response OmpR family regulator